MNDLRVFIHGLPAFERFQGKSLDMLVDKLRLVDFEPGQHLIDQGTQGHATYIIIEGTVELTHRESIGGIEQESRDARDGEVIGLLSLVDNMPSPETCTAKTKVFAAELTPERYQALFLQAPAVAHQLQYMVAVQLARDLQEKNKALRKGLAKQKPASLLERLFG
ncbi:MAG: cyclic nucleotide-binding domain-containing protein [Gammaproteobacteria bacterium]|nr:cyclic nucleotide-binding domain-containing protein [Gammaproteobacteria bacterium]MBU1646696.1 cyclic nucleotide-binding domain-containing protein [Gammaproteobacteria bacterium]MBU1971729.1 cyclic nucleotide-binding domain-containing protein [Gammaproteobacteria bacterium]